jgi:KaiC/GvpD/RAD55 family RecA-like ATPase
VTDDIEPLFGIPALDDALVPWLPPGCLILLAGDTGSETHLLAKQFANAGVGRTPVLYYTTSERTSDAQDAFRSFGWNPDPIRFGNLAEEYYRYVLHPQLEISRVRERGLGLSDLQSAKRRDVAPAPYNLTGRFLSELASLDSRFRLVLDSLDFLLEILDLPTVLDVMRQIRFRAQALGGRTLVAVQASVPDSRVAGTLEGLSDLAIRLRAEPNGSSFTRRLEIRKVRNHPERTAIRTMVVSEHGYDLAP